MHKPQPEIFRLGAERIHLPPEECVFVDDLRTNCEGAAAVGMTSVLHRGAETTLPRLEELLGVRLRKLGHTNLGVTSIYLQGIDNAEIVATVHARRAPMIPASAGLRL
jgi:FMN phosphatase YigB (HAD superfamily)